MKNVTVTEVRRDLVGVIQRITATGNSFLITDYGRPVAMIGPPPADAVAVAEDRTDTL